MMRILVVVLSISALALYIYLGHLLIKKREEAFKKHEEALEALKKYEEATR